MNVIFQQIKNVHVSYHITLLKPLIQTKVTNKLLEDQIVFGHQVFSDASGKYDHFENDILERDVVDEGAHDIWIVVYRWFEFLANII